MKKMKVVGFIVVRLDSRRLSKKAFLNLHYKKLLFRLIERINKAQLIDQFAICTSDHNSDDKIYKFAKKNKILIFRGSKKDVMSRFIVVGKKLSANHIVRITGDNPLTDPRLIDYMIRIHLKNKNEYTFSSSAPIGISSEVINYNTLTKCHSNLSDPSSSEYMSWMLNRPDIFKVQDVECPKRLAKSNSISFTVDEEYEYLNIKKIFSYYKGNPPHLNQIIDWIKTKPNLLKKMCKIKVSKTPNNVDCSFIFD